MVQEPSVNIPDVSESLGNSGQLKFVFFADLNEVSGEQELNGLQVGVGLSTVARNGEDVPDKFTPK